jgi:hypothetical protein
MKRSLALPLSCVLFGAACGTAPAGQTAQPAQTAEEPLVVVPPPPSAAPSATAEPEASAPAVPSRPPAAAGDVEACIALARGNVTSNDPAKAAGEAEYHNGLAVERKGSMADARRRYFTVIQNYPASVFVPPTYFAFGEMFAREAIQDTSKAPLAEQAFNEVLKYPPPENKLRSITQYRLGIVLSATDRVRALAMLARAAKADREAPQDSCAVEVSAAALSLSVPIFADVGDPAKAWSFYMGLTGDGARTAQRTLELVEQLARAGKGHEAIVCIESSSALGAKAQPDDAARAAYCKRVRTAGDAARPGSEARFVRALDRALAAACP